MSSKTVPKKERKVSSRFQIRLDYITVLAKHERYAEIQELLENNWLVV